VPAVAADKEPAATADYKEKKKAGAPSRHDCEEGKQYFEKLWAEKGDPTEEANQVAGWRSRSDAAKMVLAHLEKHTDENPPEFDTVRKKIPVWIKGFSAK
jgi:hypothetical protein